MTRLRALLTAWRSLPREQRPREAVAAFGLWLFGWACRGLPDPLADTERGERIKANVMDRIAEDYGTGQARKQLAMVDVVKRLATGESASRGGTNGHDTTGANNRKASDT